MIIKSFEIDKIKLTNSNIHLIYGNNEGIKQDIINTWQHGGLVKEIINE